MPDLKAKPFYLTDEDVQWVETTIASMTLDEKIGQLFCLNFRDGTPDEMDRVLQVMTPGGGMYRSIPVKNAVDFSNRLKEKCRIPMLIAANLEKGGIGIIQEGTLYATEMEVAATADPEMAAHLGEICAVEGGAVGANWSFAPIIDIDSNFHNPITNTRTFGSNPETVREMALAYIRELQSRGLAASIKHFPGDGQDERDQHLVTSINSMSTDEWDATYGMVYKACIDAGAKTVMAGHIMQPAYSRKLNPGIRDEEILPATLSKELLQGLLRGKLGFNGLIVTDDTVMVGFMVPMPREKAVPLAIENGADMFLFVNNLREDFEFMKQGYLNGVLSEKRLDEALHRILGLKASLGLHKAKAELSCEKALETASSPIHKEWARECADKAITLVKEEAGVLPITPERYPRILLFPIEESGGTGLYTAKTGTCRYIGEKLRQEGFEVSEFVPPTGNEKDGTATKEMISKYDLLIYVASLTTKSNQTVVRITWTQPRGSNAPRYINMIPTIFISTENPYHLMDVPRVKTFINTYNSDEVTLDQLVEKLIGRSDFKGKSPVDAFCGRWDTHL